MLTIVGRAENQDMGWNSERTSVSDQWGHGPVMVEGLTTTVKITAASSAKVYALSPFGARKTEVKTTYAQGVITFQVRPDHATVWYEILRE